MSANEAIDFQFGTAALLRHGERICASTVFGQIAFYGLLVTIMIFAVPYGTVEPWHKSLLVLFISVFAGFRMVDSALRGSFRIAEPLMALPLVGILGLAIVQIVPWPGLASAVSVDPYETESFILVFGGLIVAGEILFLYANSTRRLKFLIGLVIAVGVGSALFGILREVYFDTQTDLLARYLRPGQGYAQFINHNHFVVLMEMSLGLLLGILIKGGLSEKFKFFGWVFAGIMIYSVIAANSRGGLISFAALSIFAVSLHLLTRSKRSDKPGRSYAPARAKTGILIRRIAAAVGLCGLVFGLIVVTIAFVGGDTVVTRIEKLKGEVETVDNGRINRKLIWNSTLELIKERPALGVGFGGYATAITRFDTSSGKFSLQQAHNDYLEILANGGIVGLGLFTVFGVMVVSRTFGNLRSSDPLTQSSVFGAAIGIFGVLIHSFVDFGLHILVNALIFMVLIVITTGSIGKAADGRTETVSAV